MAEQGDWGMVALCVEDKPLLLEDLVRAVEASPHIAKVYAFTDELKALDWAENHRFDAAFLDIRLHGMTGLQLAEHLAANSPAAHYIFCTGYKEYALEAIRLHLHIGYLLKPIEEAEVLQEIEHIVQSRGREKPLRIQCFGMFEAYVHGEPLAFRRRKTKEFLAFLVDCRGAFVSTGEICAALWEDDSNRKNYLRQLIMELRQVLAEVGLPEVFLTRRNSYAVDSQKLDCDYYRFLDGDRNAIAGFTGKYMAGYSWAEPTCAWLISQLK